MVMKYSFLFLIILIFPCFLFAGQSISVHQLLEETGAKLYWDPLSETGEMVQGSRVLRFCSGDPALLLLDYSRLKYSGRIYQDKEGLFFSNVAADVIKEFFSCKRDLARNPRVAVILIDPGHGGKDPGTVGSVIINNQKKIVYEKDIVLTVALQLEQMLKKRYRDKEILLTRRSDTYPSLQERVELANQQKVEKNEAVIFISLHVNASLNRRAQGFEVWYLPPHVRRKVLSADEVSEEEREILPILNTMLEEEFTIESIMLAKKVLSGLHNQIGALSTNRGLKEETWFVVRNANMPSVLVELGFLSNKTEALCLSDEKYLKKLSLGVYNGIEDFVDYLEKSGVK